MITFSSMKLTNNGKSKLKKDEDGYYEVILGALNVYNSAGAFYQYNEEVKSLFESSSKLMDRLKNGYLRVEMGHPKRTPGMSERDYLMRILRIYEDKVCAHIKEIKIVDSEIREPGITENIMHVIGKIKPVGPYGPSLERDLENPDLNTAFSIRSLTSDVISGGIRVKTLKNIITWDYVHEPGISIANKFNSLALESEDECVIDVNNKKAIEDAINNINIIKQLSMEDNSGIFDEIKTTLQECSNGECLLSHWLS